MTSSKPLKLVLLVAGLVAVGIGGTILVAPGAFYATYGIELANDVSLINEVKAPGSALLTLGLLIIAGIFAGALTFASTVIAAALYLSYGMARLLSIAIDGTPDSGLVAAALIELAIGAASMWALLRYRRMA